MPPVGAIALLSVPEGLPSFPPAMGGLAGTAPSLFQLALAQATVVGPSVVQPDTPAHPAMAVIPAAPQAPPISANAPVALDAPAWLEAAVPVPGFELLIAPAAPTALLSEEQIDAALAELGLPQAARPTPLTVPEQAPATGPVAPVAPGVPQPILLAPHAVTEAPPPVQAAPPTLPTIDGPDGLVDLNALFPELLAAPLSTEHPLRAATLPEPPSLVLPVEGASHPGRAALPTMQKEAPSTFQREYGLGLGKPPVIHGPVNDRLRDRFGRVQLPATPEGQPTSAVPPRVETFDPIRQVPSLAPSSTPTPLPAAPIAEPLLIPAAPLPLPTALEPAMSPPPMLEREAPGRSPIALQPTVRPLQAPAPTYELEPAPALAPRITPGEYVMIAAPAPHMELPAVTPAVRSIEPRATIYRAATPGLIKLLEPQPLIPAPPSLTPSPLLAPAPSTHTIATPAILRDPVIEFAPPRLESPRPPATAPAPAPERSPAPAVSARARPADAPSPPPGAEPDDGIDTPADPILEWPSARPQPELGKPDATARPPLERVAAQVVQRIAVEQLPEGTTRLRFTVRPPELGPISIEVTRLGDSVSAKVITRTQEALQLFDRLLPELRLQLEARGVVVKQLDLNFQPQQQGHTPSGSQGGPTVPPGFAPSDQGFAGSTGEEFQTYRELWKGSGDVVNPLHRIEDPEEEARSPLMREWGLVNITV